MGQNAFYGYEIHGFRATIKAFQTDKEGLRNVDALTVTKIIGSYQSSGNDFEASTQFKSSFFPIYDYSIRLNAIKPGYQLGVFRVNSNDPLFVIKTVDKGSIIGRTYGDFDLDLLDMEGNRVRNK